MTHIVSSYLQGAWITPPENSDFATVRDASTSVPIALVSSAGMDVAGAIHYARTTGQASLGKFTFHQRALMLKELAQYLNGVRPELYEISARTGATKTDSMVDIDGGIGVLFTYGSKGRRELPNSNVVVDGPAENLSKDGSFIGRHIFTRLTGVTVQINAFNFPVWGMLEKLAPAFLAGVPTIVKPATPTGYLTELVVRHIVDSGILPAGALQFVSGSARDILDHLDLGDLVAFTGSSNTVDELKKHPAIAARGVRFTSETDSLNAIVLGTDAVKGTPEFDAFVRSVVTEMTVKAGQKCTSIRRVIVPEGVMGDAVDAIGARIAERVVLGDPRAEGVTMGPLASLEQRDEVRRSLDSLVAGGGRIVVGSLDEPTVLMADSESAGNSGGNSGSGRGSDTGSKGAFQAPVLLQFDDAEASAVHNIEAFGPVSSIIGYSDLDDAVRLATMGGGSLVASVVTHDPDVARQLTLGISANHGRVLILDRDDARSSTGHGSPVPHLSHGGPGRAGGGEELGGMRSVLHHMQRTAIQGSPAMLTAITGVWHTGAKVSTGGEHPFRKSLSGLKLGDSIESESRTVTLDDISAFAESTGDKFYAHTNEEAAAANPFFPGRVAHGYLLLSWAAGLFVDPEPGPVLANYGLENLRFVTPVSPGDSIRVSLTAKEITPRETEDYGEVCWDAVLHNQNDEIVATYDVLTLVRK